MADRTQAGDGCRPRSRFWGGLNFTFDTAIGKIDILGEVQGVGDYDECLEGADELELFGYPCRVISLKKLITAKRSAARAKDPAALPELEAILEHQLQSGGEKS